MALGKNAVAKMEELINKIHSNGVYSTKNKKAAEGLRSLLPITRKMSHLRTDDVARLKGLLIQMGLSEAEAGMTLFNKQ